MLLGIYEILDTAGKLTDKKKRVEYLKKNDSAALQLLIRMAFDKNLRWAIPPGSPPYTPTIYPDQEGMLYKEVKKLYIFHEGQQVNLKQMKREMLFIQLLESVMPDDAKLLIAVKDKKLSTMFKWLTPKFANELWPGIAQT